MPYEIRGRTALMLITMLGLVVIAACQSQPEPETKVKGPSTPSAVLQRPASEPLEDEIPPDELIAVMTKHFEGLGYMEQYEYVKAIKAFREVHRRAPGWIPGAINLAIGLLNDSGVKAEEAKKAGGGAEPATTNFKEALELLAGVLERAPDNPYAHFASGIILEQDGNLVEAHRHFKRVTEIDPYDATAWYWLGSTLTDPINPNRPAGPEQAKEQVELLGKAIELNPYLTPALYKLAFAYRLSGQPGKQRELLDRWKQINPDRQEAVPGPGDLAEKKYGEMGRYASVVDPFPRKAPEEQTPVKPLGLSPAHPLIVKLSEGERWVKPSDFTGPNAVIGRVRNRFGAAIAAFDADGDGMLDLYLTSAVIGPKGIRDVLLLNKGDRRFEDASVAFGLPTDQGSVGVAAADFDADRHIDVFLSRVGHGRLLHNRAGKTFEDLSNLLKPIGPQVLSLMARWLDLDQDGDLDLYVVNYCAAENADKAFHGTGEVPVGVANSVYRNDGKPTPISGSPEPVWAPLAVAVESVKAKSGLSIALTPWIGAEALLGGESPHTGIAALDVDGDRDLDLVLASDVGPPIAILNDRLGQFHRTDVNGPVDVPYCSGLLVTDLDADGRADIVVASAAGKSRFNAWHNITKRTTSVSTKVTFEPWQIGMANSRSAQSIDLDLDGRLDLLVLPARASRSGEVEPAVMVAKSGEKLPVPSPSLELWDTRDFGAGRPVGHRLDR